MWSIGYLLGFIGAVLTLASYLMKSMLPLRVMALAANFFFVAYGYLESALPSLMLYAAMIPINAKKVWEIKKLVRAIENAKADTPVSEWLLPHMHRRVAKAGTTLWHKGDKATEMLYVESGQLNLLEYDEPIGPGSLVGEIGLFAPDNRRTRTIVCATDCTLFSLSAEEMALLYYENPKLGYHVMRLIVARLMHDAEVATAHRDALMHTAAAGAAAPRTPA
ncbi:MAG: cyclic nucleotide-binding domain-containing protein [Pseudomonadota bacterium]